MLMLGLYDGANGGLLLDCTPFLVEGLTIGNDKHGLESLSATVERRLVTAFRQYARTAMAYARLWWQGQIVWEGRVEDPSVWAAAGSGLRLTAFGAWRALSDIPYTALWSATKVGAWETLTSAAIAGTATEKYAIDYNNRVYMGLQKNTTYLNGLDYGIVGFRRPSASSRLIVGLSFDGAFNLPSGWEFSISRRDDAWGAGVVLFTIAGTGGTAPISKYFAFTGSGSVTFLLYNNTGASYTQLLENGTSFVNVTNVRVVSSTANAVNTTNTAGWAAGSNVTIPVASSARMYVGQRLSIDYGATSESVIVASVPSSTSFVAANVTTSVGAAGLPIQAHVVYADEIVKDMVSVVSGLNVGQLSSNVTQIQSPALDLFDEIYEDQAMGTIIDRLATLGDNQTPPRQWEACVWIGQQLIFRPNGSASRAWFVDVSNLQALRSIETFFDSAYAVYQDASGRGKRTANATNAAIVTASGLTRRRSVPAQTTSATQALVQRDAFLDDHDDIAARSTITFERLFDIGGGNRKLWEARAGDTLTIRNLPPASGVAVDNIRTITIGRAQLNVTGRMLTIEPDPPPPQLSALLARLAANVGDAS